MLAAARRRARPRADASSLGEVLARVVCGELPEIATVARPIAARGGKVYVDFLQNGRGKLIAAPLSVRPRAGRAGLDAARVGAGDEAARPRALHDRAPRPRSSRGDGDAFAACSASRSTLPALLGALSARLDRGAGEARAERGGESRRPRGGLRYAARRARRGAAEGAPRGRRHAGDRVRGARGGGAARDRARSTSSRTRASTPPSRVGRRARARKARSRCGTTARGTRTSGAARSGTCAGGGARRGRTRPCSSSPRTTSSTSRSRRSPSARAASPSLALCDVGTRERVSRLASVELDAEQRVVRLVEKDPAPAGTLAVVALYGLPRCGARRARRLPAEPAASRTTSATSPSGSTAAARCAAS